MVEVCGNCRLAVASLAAFEVESEVSVALSCAATVVVEGEAVFCWPGVLPVFCERTSTDWVLGGFARRLSCATIPSEAAANAAVRNTPALVMRASKLSSNVSRWMNDGYPVIAVRKTEASGNPP